ncbi:MULTISPECIES: T9SS type A sorting domain-containing protein [Niastella]|uniref:Secretion system C-terminal sorting domain-containing protein n=1 Tax=Niastella soli TaxID=2821487 RepID=A0ABS3Z170_9BACT|nr:T9SS type A sorting domain-containing protein [Niastella soli]MBO9203897.1 hypothetical protein [Niastella soli]
MKRILSTLLINLFVSFSFSQTTNSMVWDVGTNTFTQTTAGCNRPACQLAGGGYFDNYPNIPFIATHGCSDIWHGNIDMMTRRPDGSFARGRGFVIQYPFKKGVRYVITVTGSFVDDNHQLTGPSLQVGFTDNPEFNANVCTDMDVAEVDISTRTSPFGTMTPTSQVLSFDLTECKQYVWFSTQSAPGTNEGWVHIHKIQIDETPLQTIDGLIGMCTGVNSQNYSITNLPAGASICWTLSNTTYAYLSGATCSPTVTVNKQQGSNSGNVDLIATITPICGAPYTIVKRIAVDPYLPLGNTVAFSSSNNYNGPILSSFSFLIPGGSGTATYNITDPYYSGFTWTPIAVPSGASWWSSGGSVSMTVQAPDVAWNSNTCTIRLTAQGPCGTYVQDFSTTSVRTGSWFSLSPNPASSEVIVTSDQSTAKSSEQELIYGIKITDQYGTIRKSLQYKQGLRMVRIPVAELRAGVYMLSVFNGKEWRGKSLVMQK